VRLNFWLHGSGGGTTSAGSITSLLTEKHEKSVVVSGFVMLAALSTDLQKSFAEKRYLGT
jgi:hypothetical protein